MKLALTEACSNSMRHAYAHGDGLVEIAFELEDDAISIEVVDDGPGFDRPAATADGDELDEGGLGLAIIEVVVDALSVERRTPGHGSRVRFRKALAPSSPDDTRSR